MSTQDETLLQRLEALAYDLWWSWQPAGERLWAALDAEGFRRASRNPIPLLRALGPSGVEARVEAIAGPLAELEAARAAYRAETETWHAEAGSPCAAPVAYFSAEFGIHECLPTYSGGLGILAGDHLKSASDLGVPLVGVGLLYRNGYVHQRLDAEGRQVNVYLEYDFADLPLRPVPDPASDPGGATGTQLQVPVSIAGATVRCAVWRVEVGRIPLYLLDTDHDGNASEHRDITARLYGGGTETRIRQEIVLGIGGVRVLERLGVEPGVFHLNEGHSAFLTLERARLALARGEAANLAEAFERTRARNVFTTHTPVEAGHDRFPPDLTWRYLEPLAEALGLDEDGLMRLGHWPGERPRGAPFNMTLLGLQTCARYNGVAALHGEVSRRMFARQWPSVPVDEVPITHVTNGVHAPSWQAPELAALLDETLPPGWRDRPETDPMWAGVDAVSDERLWALRRTLKARLIELVRRRERARRERLALPPRRDRLSPDALTIGFARRFAPYKRASLIFRDVARLLRALDGAPGPAQLLFAGKAHPADEAGKALVREVERASHLEGLAGRVAIIEDYDMEVGRALVRGVDVWLNNPRRPKEASGTSGMKAAMNGALNLSVLDGWWPEGFNGENGWAIGEVKTWPDAATQDAADAESLYALLETQVLPTWFDRNEAGLPRRWLAMVKTAIRTCVPRIHSDRQVRDYVHHLYAPG